MTDEPALRAAVADRPDDDTPRLVYADWLDDHGAPDRAAFLRAHVAFARESPRTPRYAELRARVRALRPRVDPDWARALGCGPRHRPLFATFPEARADRWRLVEEFIEVWHHPPTAADGVAEAELRAAEVRLGFPLPAALREWHALAGNMARVWSVQDRLWSPAQLHLDRDGQYLEIRIENQDCERWGIRAADLGRDDPPVWEIGAAVEASPTVSAFACVALLQEAIWHGTPCAGGEVTDDAIRRLDDSVLSRADLPDRYWVCSPVRFYEGTDLVVATHGGFWVYAAARTPEALRQLDPEVMRHLEVYR